MSRATQDVEAVRWFIHMGVLRFAYVIILLVAVLVLMLITNWKVALTGARVVKAFAREDYEGERFRREAEAVFNDSYASSRIQAVNSPIMAGIWLAGGAGTPGFRGP